MWKQNVEETNKNINEWYLFLSENLKENHILILYIFLFVPDNNKFSSIQIRGNIIWNMEDEYFNEITKN